MSDQRLTPLQRASAEFGALSTLPPAHTIRRRGDQRRRRRRALSSAALALALVAGGSGVYAIATRPAATPQVTTRHTPTPGPSAHHSPTPRPSAMGAMLPAGRVGPRSAVPWRLVGRGWVLAEYTRAPVDRAGQSPVPAPVTLYLVDPLGGRYVMYQWPSIQSAAQLLDWSKDGNRALLGSPDSDKVRQLVLATGAVTSFTLPANVSPVGYAGPGDASVLGYATAATFAVQRFSLTGSLQATLGSAPNGGPSGMDPTTGVRVSPDGAAVAVGGSYGITLLSDAGGRPRSLPVPGGATADCSALRWWDSRTVLASCASGMWLVPADGATPTAVAVPTSHTPYGGVDNVWRLPSGDYLQQVSQDCAAESILARAADGSFTRLAIPGAPAPNVQIAAAEGRQLLVEARTAGCPGSTSLLRFNPATGIARILLRAATGQQGVLGLMPYPR